MEERGQQKQEPEEGIEAAVLEEPSAEASNNAALSQSGISLQQFADQLAGEIFKDAMASVAQEAQAGDADEFGRTDCNDNLMAEDESSDNQDDFNNDADDEEDDLAASLADDRLQESLATKALSVTPARSDCSDLMQDLSEMAHLADRIDSILDQRSSYSGTTISSFGNQQQLEQSRSRQTSRLRSLSPRLGLNDAGDGNDDDEID